MIIIPLYAGLVNRRYGYQIRYKGIAIAFGTTRKEALSKVFAWLIKSSQPKMYASY